MLITDLPTEIQSRIFSEIYWKERREASNWEVRLTNIEISVNAGALPNTYDQDTRWQEDDLQAVPNLFPHTTASVCRLWQNILSSTSRYWTRFVLDLDDPACLPFDVFSWSQSELLNVLIRSHPTETSDNTKKRENERVLSVFKALTPYISSCKSIVFDVKYASSLPPPTPFLHNRNPYLKILMMESKIDDVVLPISLDIAPNAIMSQGIATFDRLSLYGAAFMEISRINPSWLSKPWTYQPCTRLTLSHLECCWKNASSYTTDEILKFLAWTRSISHLVFEHVRFVGDQPRDEEINPYRAKLDLVAKMLTFEDVDPDFIRVFASYASNKFIAHLIFKNCMLPRIPPSSFSSLRFVDIPDTQSLQNIMFHYDAPHIRFTSCPGFNDDFLNWLAINCCTSSLRTLTIKGCDQFTIAGLRVFMEKREAGNVDNVALEACKEGGEEENEYSEGANYRRDEITEEDEGGQVSNGTPGDSDINSRDYREISSLERLIVKSSPMLTDEDKIWFNEYSGSHPRTSISIF